MSQPRGQVAFRFRREPRGPRGGRRISAAFTRPVQHGVATLAFPISFHEPERSKRALYAGSIALLLHFSVVTVFYIIASLTPAIEEVLIPVRLLPAPEENAPAPKALALPRALDIAPAEVAVARIIARERIAAVSPTVRAEALKMDSVDVVMAPTLIRHSTAVVERISAVQSSTRIRASSVNISNAGSVRGPVQAVSPIGPSVGPRAVAVANTGASLGSATLEIGSGASVREGVVAAGTAVGGSEGGLTVAVNTAVGEGFLVGGSGSGIISGASGDRCTARPEVQAYLGQVKDRTLERWKLPPGIPPNERVTLRFRIDVAGSASAVEVMEAHDNAFGASAVDAMRAASPFPSMPEAARCLARLPITARFRNPL